MKNLSFMNKAALLFLFCCFTLLNNIFYSQENKQSDFIQLTFKNDGSNISGIFFKADKVNPVPTAILVQGFPGRDGDIKEIGSFLQSKGINSFVFNYRGTWKSEGLFSVDNAVSDVIKTVEFLSTPEISKKYNVDTKNIVIIGYSWGGGIIFLTGKSCPSVKKFISIGTTNLKIITESIEADTSYKSLNLKMMKKYMESKIIRGEMTGEQAQEWMIMHKKELDLMNTTDALIDKKILFIGGWNDEQVLVEKHIIPLYRSFRKRNPLNSKLILFDSDHTFSNVIPELHNCILDWINAD